MKKNYLVVLTIILLIGIIFSAVQIASAVQDTTVDNPGHPWVQLYNFPDDCTGNDFVKGFNSSGLKCFSPSGIGLWDGSATGNIWNANSGKVGIGTTSPGAKLTINNPFTAGEEGSSTDTIYAYANASTGAAISAKQGGSGYAGYFSGKVDVTGNLTVGKALILSPGTEPSGEKGKIYYNSSANMVYIYNGTGWTEFRGPTGATGADGVTGADGADGATGATGPQGPNTTNANTLTIGADWDNNEANSKLYLGVDGSIKLTIDSNGNVGIGTTGPTIDLAIGDTDTGINQDGDGVLELWTDNVDRLHITNTGNVGIGTTDPKAKLDVNGGIRISDIKTRTATTGGFACTDINTTITGLTCDSSHRGEIRIIQNTRCNRDSLCYCGLYDSVYQWICLISCP